MSKDKPGREKQKNKPRNQSEGQKRARSAARKEAQQQRGSGSFNKPQDHKDTLKGNRGQSSGTGDKT